MKEWENERGEAVWAAIQCSGGTVQGEARFVAIADFRGVNISTIADFKLPM